MQNLVILKILTTPVLFWALAEPAFARPEFALRVGQNRCTTCHESPAGGGPRNMDGKYYGANGFELSPFAKQSYAGADTKMLYYLPERHSEVKGGLGVMAVNIFAGLPLVSQPKENKEIRLVAEHNLGGFASGPRHFYLRWKTNDDFTFRWKPQYILVGRFIPAFGIMTDEHRTYVRIQTNTVWNMGFETGTLLSGNPFENWHYDLALVNGQKNQGQALNTGQATQWGVVGNWRYLNPKHPFFVGASGSYHEAEVGPGKKAPSAWALYGALDLRRWWGGRLPVTLLSEYAQAERWNASFTNTFATDASYGTSVATTASQGLLVQANWEISPHLVLMYKYDRLMLDRDYPGDVYQRHGVGAKHYFGPQMWGLIRFEKAENSVPSEKNSTRTGGLDAIWAVLSVAI